MMQDFKVPSSEINQRKREIQRELLQSGIEGLFIVQRVDLFYFSGTAQNGFLYMPAEGEPLLCIRKYMPRAQKESSIKNIVEIRSINAVPALISDFYGKLPRALGFEFDVLPVRDFNFYRTLFPDQEYVDGSPLIHRVRMVKSEWEIQQMDRTAELTRQTFEYMRTAIRPGLTEMEFAGIFETFARKLGHGAQLRVRDYQTEGYSWHILSGKNGGMVGLLDSPASGEGTSVAFPSGGGSKILAKNEPIMIDFGSVLNGYHVDETRMFAIGSMPDKAMKACQAAIEIHDAVLEKVKPGITLGELFQTSASKAKSLGYEEQYLGPPGYKVGFIGHGVGLELIESPIIAKDREDRLVPGMTFALEPKMVFQNEFAAGIESVFLVTDTGCRLITKVPVEIFIC
ncbi:MAG: aminopeptidase P family protein [Deltaproteobacteria bacterium]|nr:MAG: aminopeptidase P family protein [Deltaproteobacteria bacterium]